MGLQDAETLGFSGPKSSWLGVVVVVGVGVVAKVVKVEEVVGEDVGDEHV